MARCAVVTGASSGIGKSCALALADVGFDIFLTARREQRLIQVQEEIKQKGRDAAVLAGDLTEPDVQKEVVGQAKEKFGRIEVLLNNAGYAQPGSVEEVDMKDVRRQFEINFYTALAMMQLVGPVMRIQKSGRIINVSSICGRLSFPGLGIYSASKYALEAVSDAARREYYWWGIKVALIEPGIIDTELWQDRKERAEAFGGDWANSPFNWVYDFQLKQTEKVLQGNAPKPDVVAKAVCHAATSKRPKARYCIPAEARRRMKLRKLPDRIADWVIRRAINAGR